MQSQVFAETVNVMPPGKEGRKMVSWVVFHSLMDIGVLGYTDAPADPD